MSRRLLGSLAIAVAVGAVTVQPVGATVTTAGPQRTQTCDGTWHTVATPLDKRIDRRLYGVAAVSATDAWAVGQGINRSKPGKPLIERWDGTTWTIMASPLPSGAMNGVLHAVSVVSATDVWAVGQYQSASSDHLVLAEHWNGTAWNPVSSGILGNDVNANGVDALSATDVWLVGDQGRNTTGVLTTFAAHWNGSAWAAVPSPNKHSSVDDMLQAVSGTASGDVWAVGGYSDVTRFYGLVEHWNGSAWSILKSPATAFVLNGVAATSATNAWSVSVDGSGNFLETERWNGTAWNSVSNVPGSEPTGDAISAAGADDIWLIGTTYPESGQRVPLAEHWNGFSWTRVSSTFPVAIALEMHGVSVTADGGTAFAVGAFLKTDTGKARSLAEIWC